MKIIYLFVLFVLGSTLSNAYDSQELDSIVESLKPQRTQPLLVMNRPQEKFHEFYVSGADLSCGFRIFGLERQEGINLIRQNLNRNTVKKFVSNSIFREEKSSFQKIYGKDKETLPDLKKFSEEDSNHRIYLDFYAEDNRTLPLEMNRVENGEVVPGFNRTFGLLDALAYIKKKNLSVYIRREDQSLILMHSFRIEGGDYPFVRSLYHKNHFNLLVDSSDEKACEEAVLQEMLFLHQQKRNLASFSDLEEAAPAQVSDDSSLLDSRLIEEEEFTEYFDYTKHIEHPSSVSASLSQINDQRVDSCVSATATPSLLAPLHREERVRGQARPFPPRRDLNLTLESVSQFINQDKNRFPELTRKESIEAAFAFLQNALTAIPSLLSVEDKILYQFGMVRLFLEFQYHPAPLTSEQHGRDLTAHMNSIIKGYFKSKEAKLKRFANYARIYLGKLFVILRDFDKAYNVFQKVGNNYTKTYLVDMAEMIIDHGYRPPDLGDRDPNTFAISLLTQASHHTSTGDSRSHTGKRVRRDNSESIGRPLFLQNKVTKERKEALYRVTQRREDHSIQLRRTDRLSPAIETFRLLEHATRPFSQVEREPIDGEPSAQRRKISQGDKGLSSLSLRRGASLRSPIHDNLTPTSEEEFTTSINLDSGTESDLQSDYCPSPDGYSPLFLEDRREEDHELSRLTHAFSSQDQQEECRRLLCLGRAHRNEVAASYFQSAKKIAEKIGDSKAIAKALIGLGNARDGNQIEHYRAALDIAREIGDRSLEAQALIGLGNVRHGNNIEHYRAALDIAREIGDRSLEAQVRIGLGNARDGNQIEHHRAALDIAREIGERSLEAQAHIGLGNARAGKEHYRAALDIAREIGDRSLEAQARIGLGNARDGNQIEHYRTALEIAREIGDRSLEAQALVGLGNVSHGNNIEHYRAALDIAREIGERSLEAQALVGLGNARDGNNIEHYRAALNIAREIGNRSLEAQACIGLGNARDNNRIEHYRAALDIAREIGDRSLEAQALIGLGNARAGKEHYRAALDIAREIGDRSLEAQALIGLGNAYSAKRDNATAHQHFSDAVKIAPTKELREKARAGRERAERFLRTQDLRGR